MSPIINHLNHYNSTRHGEKETLVEVDHFVQVVDHFVSSPDLVAEILILNFILKYLHFKGFETDQRWVSRDCDMRDLASGWDRAPCSACSFSNDVSKNIQFRWAIFIGI